MVLCVCQYLVYQRFHQGFCSFLTQELLGVKQEKLVQTIYGELQQQTALFCAILRVKESFIYISVKEKKRKKIKNQTRKLPHETETLLVCEYS